MTHPRKSSSVFSPHHPADAGRFCLPAVLIDAIVRNGGSGATPEAGHVPPPSGWRDEDVGRNGTSGAGADEKKSYTEDQRQGVHRCALALGSFLPARRRPL